jgi:hypothetical protein
MNLQEDRIIVEATQRVVRNIIERLEEEICCEGGCLDPYCKAMVEAVEIIKGNREVDQ